MRLPWATLLFLAILPGQRCFAAPPVTSSDEFGTIVGKVVDRAGRPISFANVIVLGTRRGAGADEKGTFRISLVPLGVQTLRIMVSGWEPETRVVNVQSGINRLENVALGLGVGPEPSEPLAIGTEVEVAASDLVAEIRPVRKHFKLWESPAFEVRIYNRGTRPVVLVKCREDSDYGGSPRGEIHIAAPFNAFVPPRGAIAFCATRRGPSLGDFIEVEPGQYFDPFMDGDWTPASLSGTFTRPGRYGATFSYSTTDTIAEHWLGRQRPSDKFSQEFRELMARVPAIELEAKTTFKVDY